jgi:hypothetical protein
MFCAGNRLYLHTCKNESQDSFNRSIARNGAKNCTTHYIREITLFNLVLTHLQRVLAYVRQFEGAFVKQVAAKSTDEQKWAITAKQQALELHGKRIAELDLLFQRVYEDSVGGKIIDERFLKKSSSYESDQAALKAESAKLETELAEEKQAAVYTEQFISLVKNYTEIDTLSPAILNEFTEKTVVHAGQVRQQTQAEGRDILQLHRHY